MKQKKHLITVLSLVLCGIAAYYPAVADDQTGPVRPSAAGEATIPLPANPARLPIIGTGLEFPFKNANPLVDIRSYGISPWGFEPVHNGIDMIVDNTGENLRVGDRVPILSPVEGTVYEVFYLYQDPSDPKAGVWILVVLEINPSLLVTLSFEPQSTDPALQSEQVNAISVRAGQTIRKGQVIGDLIVGEGGGSGSGNPHIDFRLILKNVDTTVWDIITGVVTASHNNVTELPTFLCPYDYSSLRAKTLFEKVLSKDTSECRCPCRFSYNAEECGAMCVD